MTDFDGLFQHVCRRLKQMGMAIAIEDDLPDFKCLYASSDTFRDDLFRMVDVVLSDNGDFHFMFHTRKGRKKQTDLTAGGFRELKQFVSQVLAGSGYEVTEIDDIRRRYLKPDANECRDPEAIVMIEVHGGFAPGNPTDANGNLNT